MAINLAAERDLLLPGLAAITGQYRQIEPQWKRVFRTIHSKMQIERTVQARYMSLAAMKDEGAQTLFDNNAGERWIYNMEPQETGLGYAITRKAIDDNLYKSDFNPMNLGLAKSFADYWEIIAANIFNTAGTYQASLGGDGVGLLSNVHPLTETSPFVGGTWSNRPAVDVDLNEATLISGMKAVRSGFVNEAGLKIRARAKLLLVPINLEDVAIRLTKTDLRPGTMDNDINAIHHTSGGIREYEVFDYFTSNYAWFLKTDVEGLIHIDRIPFELDMHVDFMTDNLLVKGYQRAGFFYNDPRCLYGSLPTS
jgi:hypothetical protein